MTTGLLEEMIAVALAGLLEGIGVPWPGALVVAGAGIAVGGGFADLLLLTAVFGVAYSSGALIQYAIGRFLGQKAMGWMPLRYREKIERMMGRYGLAAVFFTRPLVIGNYVSAPAGIMRMPLRRFLPSTFLGICPWALGLLVAGDALAAMLGGAQDVIAQYWVPVTMLVGAATLAPAAWKRLRRATAEPEVAAVHGD